MPTLITLISTLAVLVAIVGIVPQLVTMLRMRSAGGQSPLGWILGAAANLAFAFVNGLGYHAMVLAAGDGLSVVGCLTALALVLRYGRHDRAEASAPADRTASPNLVADMHTQEFVVLREAVLAEHHRRTGEFALGV